MLASISIDEASVTRTRIWRNALVRARDAWVDTYRHGHRYSDAELPPRQNSLTNYRRDGGR
jgi:hypothetical protein